MEYISDVNSGVFCVSKTTRLSEVKRLKAESNLRAQGFKDLPEQKPLFKCPYANIGTYYKYLVHSFSIHTTMNSMKLVIPLHSLYWSIHTKDESKRGTEFAFIFGVN